MNLYLRSVGFRDYTPQDVDGLVGRAISAAMKTGSLMKNARFGRAQVLYGTSESTGVAIYGRLEGENFIFEHVYPYVLPDKIDSRGDIFVIRNRRYEGFQAILPPGRVSGSVIQAEVNPMGILDIIEKNPEVTSQPFSFAGLSSTQKISLPDAGFAITALALSGMIILPAMNEETALDRSDVPGSEETGSEEAEEKAGQISSEEDMLGIGSRIRNENIFSIVDTTLFPNGAESEGYTMIGKILDLRVEENILTDEKIYLLKVETNGNIIYLSVNGEDVIGEPKAGRRFQGPALLRADIMYTSNKNKEER